MRLIVTGLTLACVLAAGCTNQSAQQSAAAPESDMTMGDAATGGGAGGPGGGGEAGGPERDGAPDEFMDPREEETATAVAIESGVVNLSPGNSKIVFVGTHVGDTPNPRTGGFERFMGTLQVDEGSSTLTSVSIQIETESLWTQIERLTTHLRSPDFFEVREYPTATFQSTSVQAGGAGSFDVTGELTLHGVTKEISFPATVQFGDGGLRLEAEFSLDRSEFGMTWGTERVVNEVSLTVTVGEKTEPLEPQAFGGGGGGRGRRGGGGFDPAQMFARWDADEDGKLSGDEIPDRMRESLEATDTDSDGAISLEEFQQRMRQFSGGGGRRGGGQEGGGQDRPQRPESE